jgi:Fe-S-cluster-containing dehydrogenase component
MEIKRRSFLKGLAGAGAGVAAAPLIAGKALGRETYKVKPTHVGMLYDNTRCVGCKSCEVACKRANNMPPELEERGMFDAPRDLSDKTLNIIKLYQGEDDIAYVKRQCMHCADPSCVSGCPVTALIKDPVTGIVTYDPDACCGCRYCQMNCPFNIPKFEFNEFYGVIRKCELCRETNLSTRGQPACTEACPNGAVIFGRVEQLLVEARRRIDESPHLYVDHIYGEKEGGGTSVLYLSKVPFEKLGFPTLPEYSQASVSEGIQHTLYQGLILPGIVYAGLAAIAYRNRSRNKED